jgi:hypothetical protein
VIVTDWDGYRDTVRDGEDGFRIPTYAPAPGSGAHIASAYETGELNYDYMIFRACMAVGVDFDILVDRVATLVDDAELRQRMGQAALERARTVYDWAVVYRRFQALWDELDAIRVAESGKGDWSKAPRCAPGRQDPFSAFGAFPTHHIGPDSRISARPAASTEAYFALQASPLFEHWKIDRTIVSTIFEALAEGEQACARLAALTHLSPAVTSEVLGRLVKMGLVDVR